MTLLGFAPDTVLLLQSEYVPIRRRMIRSSMISPGNSVQVTHGAEITFS